MKLWEAMKALESGKKVRRIDWAPDEYIYLDIYHEVINNNGGPADKYLLDNIHMTWEIYKDKDDLNKSLDFLPII